LSSGALLELNQVAGPYSEHVAQGLYGLGRHRFHLATTLDKPVKGAFGEATA
jgi:hypothetical protein